MQIDTNRIIDRKWRDWDAGYYTTYGIRTERYRWEDNYRMHGLDAFMEPEIFARFGRVFLDTRFNYDISHLPIKQPYLDMPAVMNTFNDLLAVSPLFQQYINVVSNLPDIHHFSIRLQFHLQHPYHSFVFDSNPPSQQDQLAVEPQPEKKTLQEIYNRGITIFMESGILEPLGALRNIRSFDLSFRRFGSREAYPAQYLQLGSQLKQDVERAFEQCHVG